MGKIVETILSVCGSASVEFIDTDRFRVYLPIPEGNGVWKWLICTDEIESELYKIGYIPNYVPKGMWEEGWCEFVRLDK